MSKQISQKPLNLLGGDYGLLNAGVSRIMFESEECRSYRPTFKRLIVRSKVEPNGDVSEFTELVDPDSIVHPLDGVIYDPASMSLTAQLSAGVELKEVHPGLMYADPLEAERIALRANSYIQKVVASNEEARSAAEPQPAEPQPAEPQPSKS